MEQHVLLIEYLKEHYAQARQHETLRTNCTTFLTAAAGVILGNQFKNGDLHPNFYCGFIIFLIGCANFKINKSHFFGNRFHTKVAKYTRQALEQTQPNWTVDKPSKCRDKAYKEMKLPEDPNFSVGKKIQKSIQIIPAGVMVLGLCSMASNIEIINMLFYKSASYLNIIPSG